MSSTFRRKGNRTDPIGILKGTKLWTGGISISSSGNRELDVILGGGQPLGTSILIEEDRWSQDLSLCLVKNWCAEVFQFV
jgi:PAXNEB protein